MSPRRLFQRNRKPDAHQSSQENDHDGLGTSNVRTAPPHTLPGRDSVRLPYETESHTNTPGLAGASKVASPNLSYSKRPSRNQFFPLLIYVNFVSILPYLC